MDNLAHAVVGAALGRAVAGRKVPAAGWIGAVAANAPDWTEPLLGFRPFRGSLGYYTLHRGITHSFIGAAVESAAITGVVWGLFVLLRRRIGTVSLFTLGALVTLTVWSHVYMDWQGSYGLRPWLPWSGRWYYADWVAIVDPLFWVVPLVGLAWGAERHWMALTPALLLAGFVLWAEFIWRPNVPAPWMRAVSVALVVLGAVGWVRHWFGVAGRRAAAAWSLAVLAVYAGMQAVASVPAKARVQHDAVARFGPDASWAALTSVGRPFQWEAMYASRDSVAGPGWAVPRHLDDEHVQAALRQTAAGRAMGGFARFLAAEVDSTPSLVVRLRDVRYARTATSGWGVVTVPVSMAGGSP
ncbi:MAG TPA: metal-dependent hydrolase [Gemmatimonadales bacterium]